MILNPRDLPCLLLASIFAFTAGLSAQNLLDPKGKPDMPGLVNGNPVFLLSVIDALFAGRQEPVLSADESLSYNVKAKWGWLSLSGKMQASVRREIYSGREVYRLEQSIRVYGRYMNEVSIIDAEGLFPYEYTRRMRRPGEDELVESLLWDHFGRKLFATSHKLRRGRPSTQLHYEEFRLGEDIAADAIDPLSAVFLYRMKCSGQASAAEWKKAVIAGPGERYVLKCMPTGSVWVVTNDCAGTCRAVKVNWFWDAGNVEDNRLITTVLSLEKDAVPVDYAATIWGIPGTAELRECRHVPAVRPREEKAGPGQKKADGGS